MPAVPSRHPVPTGIRTGGGGDGCNVWYAGGSSGSLWYTFPKAWTVRQIRPIHLNYDGCPGNVPVRGFGKV